MNSMSPRHPRAIAHALARSKFSVRILVALSEVDEATLDQLARVIRIRPSRALALLEGRLPEYHPKSSLLCLGLVQRRRRRVAVCFELTPLGRATVARLVAGRLL